MSWDPIFWMLLLPLAAVFLVLIVLVVAAKVTEVIPHATPIDVTALAVTGVLTGFFLALGLSRRVA